MTLNIVIKRLIENYRFIWLLFIVNCTKQMLLMLRVFAYTSEHLEVDREVQKPCKHKEVTIIEAEPR